jgi:hypothetical protein
MRLRVVVYAEGEGETGGEARGLPPRPGDSLTEDRLGPGHILVRRALAAARGVPEAAVAFEQPLRTGRGPLARGSHLHQPRTIRELLTWISREREPELAVVLVDADGNNSRRATMLGWIAGLHVEVALGVAAQEFEAWLIADVVALSRALGTSVPQPPDPESMKPREAKKWLSDRIAEAGADSRAARLQIANELDLDRLKSACRSFEEFLGELVGRPR